MLSLRKNESERTVFRGWKKSLRLSAVGGVHHAALLSNDTTVPSGTSRLVPARLGSTRLDARSILVSISDYRLIADGAARSAPKIVALRQRYFTLREGETTRYRFPNDPTPNRSATLNQTVLRAVLRPDMNLVSIFSDLRKKYSISTKNDRQVVC